MLAGIIYIRGTTAAARAGGDDVYKGTNMIYIKAPVASAGVDV